MRQRALPRPGPVGVAGLVGAAVGVAAAGIAAGMASQRALVRRYRSVPGDPYAQERFGSLPHDAAYLLEMRDGTDIYVEEVEPTDEAAAGRPTVVFVHGFCLDMGTFHFQRKALTARGTHRVISYDQPGHGRSGRLETGEYELTALGRTLRAVIERAAPTGPLVLVGHSMGGMTIMAFAELFPRLFAERVVGTVLISTSGRLEQGKFGLPAMLARAGSPLLYLVNNATRLSGTVIDRARLASSDLAWLLTRRYGFGTTRPSPALVSYVEEMNSRTSVDTVTRYLRTLYTHARYPVLADLARKPTLVIVGALDMITPVTHTEEILRRLPGATYLNVPDSGHVVMLEHADEVNAALLGFLDGLDATAGADRAEPAP